MLPTCTLLVYRRHASACLQTSLISSNPVRVQEGSIAACAEGGNARC